MKPTLEELKEQLNSLTEQIKKYESEPEYELHKWYKVIEACNGAASGVDKIGMYTNEENNNGCFGGVNHCIKTASGDIWGFRTCRLIPATDKEVKEALKKEAIKIGFKEGVRFKAVGDNSDRFCVFKRIDQYYSNINTLTSCIEEHSWCDSKGNYISSNPLIFRDGKWAEIIKDEVIKIGGYDVEFCGDLIPGKLKEEYTRIDGNKFTKEFWQAAKVISEHNKAKIMVGCSKQFDVSLETINKILDKL